MAKKPIHKAASSDEFIAFSNRYQQLRHDEIFIGILNSMLCIASLGKAFQEEFDAAKKTYGEEALLGFIHYVAEKSDGFHDALGEIYEYISSSSHSSALGQYFTPLPIAQFMANIVMSLPSDQPQAVADPSGCGSGRMILAAARNFGGERWRHHFFGVDIDGICAKLTTVNCWLNTVPAIIVHGDGLALDYWNAYEVVLNWDADAGKWIAFVVKQSDETVAAMAELQKQGFMKKALDRANEKRTEKLVSQKAEREAAKLNAFIAALETPVTHDATEDDKTPAPEEIPPPKPAQAPRRGKQPPPNQSSLF